MGSDVNIPINVTHNEVKFQSTLPGWGATGCDDLSKLLTGISIHAPRMGSDQPHLVRDP